MEKQGNIFIAGVGGIETEAVMLGMPVTLTLPEVVGCELTGTASPLATSIDIVLGITKVSSVPAQTEQSVGFEKWNPGRIFGMPLVIVMQKDSHSV